MLKNHTRKTRLAVAAVGVVAVAVPSVVVGIANPASAASTVVPTVTKLSVTANLTTAVTNVLITGRNFSDVVASTLANVSFGSVAATSIVVLSDTQIVATAAAHAAGTYQVKVTNPIGASLDVVADNITFVAPFTTATSASALKINPFGGTNIVATASVGWTDAADFAALKVTAKIGNVVAKATYLSPTTATVTMPAGVPSNTAPVVLLYKLGLASTATGTPLGKYAAVITKLSKTSGPTAGGGTITITGKGLTGGTLFKFGLTNTSTGTAAASTANLATGCTVVNDTTATCTIPAAPLNGYYGAVSAAFAGSVSVSFLPANSVAYATLPGATYTYTDLG